MALLDRAPNLNAAKVFINWFLSREGQLALQRALNKAGVDAPDSLRVDIPKDEIKPGNRRMEAVRYLDLDSRPEWIDMKPIVNVFEEAFGRKQKN